MPLTRRQLDAIRVLDWLLGDTDAERATGRSMAIAVSLIRQALRHPGRRTYFIDHVARAPIRDRQLIVSERVQHLVGEDSALRHVLCDFRRDYFSIQGLNDARLPSWQDWAPSEAILERNRQGLRPDIDMREILAQEQGLNNLLDDVKYAKNDPNPTRWERILADEPGEPSE